MHVEPSSLDAILARSLLLWRSSARIVAAIAKAPGGSRCGQYLPNRVHVATSPRHRKEDLDVCALWITRAIVHHDVEFFR